MAFDRNHLNWLRKCGYIALACMCLFLASAEYASAQVDQGSITGTVTDTTGAVVPDALVTLLNTDVGLSLKNTTNSGGEYTFSPVRIGRYTVTVTAKGFAKTTQQNITVNVAQRLQVNVLEWVE